MTTGNNLERPRHQIDPTLGYDLERSVEILPRTNRMIVFGSNLSGGWELSDLIEDYMEGHGLPKDDLLWSRHVGAIEHSFYKTSETAEERQARIDAILGTTAREITPTSLLGRIGSKFLRGSVAPTPSTHVATTATTPEKPDSLPLVVFALPEMRAEGASGAGMSVGTPFDRIQELCDKHGVPLFRIERYTAEVQAQIEKGLAGLEPQSSLPDAK